MLSGKLKCLIAAFSVKYHKKLDRWRSWIIAITHIIEIISIYRERERETKKTMAGWRDDAKENRWNNYRHFRFKIICTKLLQSKVISDRCSIEKLHFFILIFKTDCRTPNASLPNNIFQKKAIKSIQYATLSHPIVFSAQFRNSTLK